MTVQVGIKHNVLLLLLYQGLLKAKLGIVLTDESLDFAVFKILILTNPGSLISYTSLT